MSIYIKNLQGQFVPATDIDLQNRGYSSTQELGSIPQIEEGEVKLTVTDFISDKKVKVIKVVRNVCNEYYGRTTHTNKPTTYTITPPTQGNGYDDNAFGLRHMKHFVEGACSLTISVDCYRKIKGALTQQILFCTFEEEYTKGSNNLERLQAHRAQLKEEMRKTDDLIAYQLYS